MFSKNHLLILLFLQSLILVVNYRDVFTQEVRVNTVTFHGNKKISDGELKKVIKTKGKPWTSKFRPWKKPKLYDEGIFFDDLLRVRKFYREEGFWQAKVNDHELTFNDKQDEVNIIINVEEREPLIVEQVAIDLAPEITKEIELHRLKKLLRLEKGKRYRERELIADHDTIIEWFGNRGYPYIKANVEEDVDQCNYIVSLTWQLRPGIFSRFGEIKFTGLVQISQKVLEHGLEFKPGEAFSQKKLDDSRGRLYRSGLFQFVKVGSEQQQDQSSEIPVDVRVKETSAAKLAFGVGYSTEGAFRVFSGLEQRDFLGGGRLLKTIVLHSTNLIPLLAGLELNQPFFFSARNNLKIRPFFVWFDEKAFESKSFILETTLSREISEAVSVFLTTELSTDDVETKSEIIEENGFNKKSKLRTGLTWNTSDQVFNPTRGFYSTLFVEESGRILDVETKYFKLFAEHRKYFSIFQDNVLAIRLSVGSIKPQGDGEIPIEERFFSGGTFSVRGWRRQLLGPSTVDVNGNIVPLGGNSQIEGSLELRRPLFRKIASAFFLDYGNVWQDWDGFDLFDLRYAIGLGLRYNTIIGPLRLDFAWKLNKQELDTRNYEVHFSLGQAF